jgi:general L-amino acid transport system permease protein
VSGAARVTGAMAGGTRGRAPAAERVAALPTKIERAASLPQVAFYNNPKVRAVFYQLLLLAAVLWFAWEFALNAKANLDAKRITSGFGFLDNTAGFGVNQTLIPYQESDSYGRVFLVGLLNTLLVSAIGIVLATVIGFIIGIARLSSNWLIARLAGGYVELIRNLPLLFQILFWYLAVLGTLPGPRQSIGIGWQPVVARTADAFEGLERHGLPAALARWCRSLAEWIGPPELYLNNRGLIVPQPVIESGAEFVGAAVVLAIAAAIGVRTWAVRRQARSGEQFPIGWATIGLLIVLPLAALIAFGFPISFTRPELRGFNFVGGVRLIPEFVALLIALSTYTGAFIAEIVRAGILAVSRGQTEAALALGLRRGLALRLIIVPQALRLIVPPLTNQYLNLTKNSSLAVAIGYPDLVAVFAGTTLNQTGQAIEIIAITMAVYLAISLITSGLMNWYNARVRVGEH